MVVGAIDPRGRRVVAHGKLEAGDPRQLDGDTLFEIGSVTKVFTALLLADMVARGEVALGDPVGKLLSAEVKVPERGGRAITLLDLATHTSALPRMPANFAPKDPWDPYADYSIAQLNDFLSTHALTRDIGTQYEYSNLGVGLLGLALARRAGMDYETLVRTRIAEPLAMASTRITLSPALQARLAVGHDGELTKVASWHLSEAFVGAGALRSSANDLLVFLAANLGYASTPLAPAMADMLKVRRPIGGGSHEMALGWHVLKRANMEIVWHNGQTGGYHSYVGYDAKTRTGVVVLSNSSSDIDDIGMHLLDASLPLKKQRKEITVDPDAVRRLCRPLPACAEFHSHGVARRWPPIRAGDGATALRSLCRERAGLFLPSCRCADHLRGGQSGSRDAADPPPERHGHRRQADGIGLRTPTEPAGDVTRNLQSARHAFIFRRRPC